MTYAWHIGAVAAAVIFPITVLLWLIAGLDWWGIFVITAAVGLIVPGAVKLVMAWLIIRSGQMP